MRANLVAVLVLLAGVYTLPVQAGSSEAVAERDPTRPAVRDARQAQASSNTERSARLPDLRLNLIRYSSQSSVAVINGEHYRIGDELSGWQIRGIEADRVLLARDNEVIVLSVFAGATRSNLQDNP